MPFPTWTPPTPDPAKPWTLPRPGDERRVPPPSEDGWWNAIQTGDVKRVSAWLDGPCHYAYDDPRSALLSAKNQVGQTALGWLVENHDLADSAVRLLPVLLGSNSSPMASGHTVFAHLAPFWVALEHPDERVARTMWDHLGTNRVSEPCWLHDAVEAQVDDQALQRLITWGLPVNAQTAGQGDTALHAVIKRWNTARFTQALDLLLNAGADPRIVNRRNVSAFGLASARARDHSSLEPVVERLGVLSRHLTEREALNQALNEVPGIESLPPAGGPRTRL